LQARADANFAAIQSWVDQTDWVANLADNPATRSNTSVCLKVTDLAIAALDDAAQKAFCKKIVTLLDAEDAAYDIGGYRDAPAGLRIWCGATVDASDVEALTPWLDWAFATAKADLVAA
jgi:phosphoserine aminotransferase